MLHVMIDLFGQLPLIETPALIFRELLKKICKVRIAVSISKKEIGAGGSEEFFAFLGECHNGIQQFKEMCLMVVDGNPVAGSTNCRGDNLFEWQFP